MTDTDLRRDLERRRKLGRARARLMAAETLLADAAEGSDHKGEIESINGAIFHARYRLELFVERDANSGG